MQPDTPKATETLRQRANKTAADNALGAVADHRLTRSRGLTNIHKIAVRQAIRVALCATDAANYIAKLSAADLRSELRRTRRDADYAAGFLAAAKFANQEAPNNHFLEILVARAAVACKRHRRARFEIKKALHVQQCRDLDNSTKGIQP